MTEIKHGGCYRCKTKGQEILTSVTMKRPAESVALCDDCLKTVDYYGKNKENSKA